jgi:cytochrome b6-f complex iron-sulfur subunit
MRLPVLSSCGGCTRRVLLRGFGIAAATSLLGACRISLENPTGGPDGGGGGGGGGGGSGSGTTCGSNLCLDLNASANAGLVTVGGSLVVPAPSDKIIVVRTSESEFAALSDVCTHMACTVHYDATSMLLVCPCHGSRFTLSGSVARGPALKPLASYTTSYDSTTDVLTITL